MMIQLQVVLYVLYFIFNGIAKLSKAKSEE
jgi:hypothetical protein